MASSDDPDAAALQRVLEERRPQLESASHSASAQGWLKPRLNTAVGMEQVYAYLQASVSAPAFLAKLARAREAAAGTGSPARSPQGAEVQRPEWWQPPDSLREAGQEAEAAEEAEAHKGPGDDFAQVSSEEAAEAPPVEPLDEYVMVEKDDVMEAISEFVATYLMQLPEAQNLKPEELQRALGGAIAELRSGRIQRLWAWGRCLYRCIAFSYGAFSVYENPWIVRALLAALWTSSRVLVGCLL